MRKVLSFSAFLMMGLLVSQILPGAVGEGYTTIKSVSDVLLYICLSFIMINVGREFVMDKTRWKSYVNASLSLTSSSGATALKEGGYWSSTEYSGNNAWLLRMDGRKSNTLKIINNQLYVRPVVKY